MSRPWAPLRAKGRNAPMKELLAGWTAAAARRVFVRDFTLAASIGVHPHEREAPQPIVVSLDLQVDAEPADAAPGDARFSPPERADDPAGDQVVCYESLTNMVTELVGGGHIDYVETLAERIAERCLEDPRVLEALVRVEKPNAIAAAASAGVEILRRR